MGKRRRSRRIEGWSDDVWGEEGKLLSSPKIAKIPTKKVKVNVNVI